MGFFSDFGSDFIEGFTGTDYVKDYAHASKLMRADAFANAPNLKFLFHVYFSLNVPTASDDKGMVGALVKSVTLPAFDLDVQEYVQYNRKRNVHNRIKYRPVSIKLHDDSSDTVRSMWHNYYQYYFSDTDYEYDSTGGNQSLAYTPRDIYEEKMSHPAWGVTTKHSTGTVKPAFFKDIQIFGMSRGYYVSYTLINPTIASFAHDTYDYEQVSGTMTHSMEIKYEAVKYARGKLENGIGIPGFGMDAASRYDTTPGPLSKAGSTASVLGTGGILDTATGALEDLSNGNILGAIRGVAASAKTYKRHGGFKDSIKEEFLGEARKQLPGIVTGLSKKVGGPLYPKASQQKTTSHTSTPSKALPIDESTGRKIGDKSYLQ